MRTKANIYLLPTSKEHKNNGFYFITSESSKKENLGFTYYGHNPHHLYVTLPQSDLEMSKIEEGDWYIIKNVSGEAQFQQCCRIEKNRLYFGNYNIELSGDKSMVSDSIAYCEKIIATTDSSLKTIIPRHNDFDSEYSLPAIPQSFISQFIREYNGGNLIKEVELNHVERNYWNDKAKEVKLSEEAWKNIKAMCIPTLKLNQNNEISIVNPEERKYSREELLEALRFAIVYPENFVTGICWDKDKSKNWIEENLK